MENQHIPDVRTTAAAAVFWMTTLAMACVVAALTANSPSDIVGFALLGALFLSAGVAVARYAVLGLMETATELEELRTPTPLRNRAEAPQEDRRAA
jgi:hypothetical protein